MLIKHPIIQKPGYTKINSISRASYITKAIVRVVAQVLGSSFGRPDLQVKYRDEMAEFGQSGGWLEATMLGPASPKGTWRP